MARGEEQARVDVESMKFLGMRLLVFVILNAAALCACGGVDDISNTKAVNTGSTSNASNAAPADSARTFGNTNTFNADANRPVDAQMRRLEEMSRAANRSGKPIPSMNSRPAPEDSTISATLTDFARETRVWKKHPVLAKVEKLHNGGDGSIRVYLRNGKVIDLPGNSIAQLDQIPAASVLALAGVTQPPAAPEKDPAARRARN